MKRFALLLTLVCSPIAVTHAADAPVAHVTMVDGRVLDGQVDDATDNNHLWLRRGAPDVLLSVSYRWDEVAAIEIGGATVTPEELLQHPDEYVAAWPEYFLFAEHLGGVRPAACLAPPMVTNQRAGATSFVATLANWDGDVEPDGYEIAVTVVDNYGNPMPVRGTLSAKLVGERTDRRAAPFPPVELERWSESIDPRQFAGGPAVFRLPFRSIRPERELDLAPGGILQIEVGAFGHGRFAASSAVPLREFNPVRDRFEQRTGSRFFPGERSE